MGVFTCWNVVVAAVVFQLPKRGEKKINKIQKEKGDQNQTPTIIIIIIIIISRFSRTNAGAAETAD